MKKIFSLLVMMIVLNSCGETVEFNNSSVLQGVRNNEFWKADVVTATMTATTLIIEGEYDTETLTLRVPLPSKMVDPMKENTFITHLLGISANKKAIYTITNAEGTVIYETGIDEEDGQIVISEFDGAVVSGSFRFNAFNIDEEADENDIVNYQNGVFYKIPLTTSL